MPKKVALAGATGSLGSPILSALISAGFDTTAFKRQGSLSVPGHADVVPVVEVPSKSPPLETWTEALRGFDACVVAFRTRDVDLHLAIAEAAAKAGVKHFIPADFGSADSSSPRTRELVPLFSRKTQVREKCQELVKEYPGFSWTSLVTGHFFDWGLENGFMMCDLRLKKALVIGDGKYRASASTLHRIAEATALVLQRTEMEEVKNKMIYVQSFCVTQLEIVESLEKAMGEKWEITFRDMEEYIAEQKKLQEEGDHMAIENLVFVLGTSDANWEEKGNFAMKALGLEDESLNEIVSGVVKEVAHSSKKAQS
ncbi:hypothetical protein MKZ38_006763 [Zalerion maritima]|uniref:NmrA-like domain-containing protein n=1 Tax=Zalerion maritima TaxID=339359 RepID=A0AAD5WNA1_9PEZI|nr:hypothetical protein MKZ38_006763 [Zalerion maritima]